MTRKRYYSERAGTHPTGGKYDLPMLQDVVLEVWASLERDDYLQEAFGFWCPDERDVAGSLGPDIEGAIFLALRKRRMWPLDERVKHFDESDLFDMLEFLHDHVAAPVDGWMHQHNGCGMHYETFDFEEGRAEFRARMNPHLADYREGYELSDEGEVVALGVPELAPLFHAGIPDGTPEPVRERMAAAISKFRRRDASREERRDAIRDLADVLEYLREPARKVITKKDESDLFNLANNFGIRHHNDKQQVDYDELVWFSWMFYYYLATIHALIRLIRQRSTATEPA